MIEMLNNVRDSYDQKSPERDDYDDDDPSGNIVNRMCNMHILALDDIGREKSTEWTQEMFYLIVNRRYEDMAITHFASNFSLGELADVVDARIARRIGEMCRVVNLNKRVSDG
jgi:DNA replication protein DnaC